MEAVRVVGSLLQSGLDDTDANEPQSVWHIQTKGTIMDNNTADHDSGSDAAADGEAAGGASKEPVTGIRKYEAAIVGILVGVVSAAGFGLLVMAL